MAQHAGQAAPHVPAPGRPAPTATYRVQLRPEFGFVALAEQADYLAALGVSHAYLSPILQAVPGSTHGYDVIDHSRLSDDLGGGPAFSKLTERLREVGLGAVVDVVPNHVAVPTPASLNTALWSVLRDGPASPYGRWFDVDWSVEGHALLMPVLGRRIGECLADGEIVLDRASADHGGEPVLRYFDHVFPVRPGTEDLPLPALVDRQWYRLAWWRVADEELNYRRFFDVDTLAGLRVEHEEVFAESHALLVSLLHEGALEGLRIDHPDGLADPRGYLRRLAEATDGCWVVVEKILEGREQLPDDWPCAGTTGYDALLRVGGVLVDAAGAQPLTDLYTSLTGEPASCREVEEEAKRYVVEKALYAEVDRLVEVLADVCRRDVMLRDHTRRGLREALVEMLVAFHVYRAYVVPGEEPPAVSVGMVEHACEDAKGRLPSERHATADLVRDLALGRLGRDARRDEFCVRFQQTCGPVMAKGIEDTAFYRWLRLTSLNEVGGDAERLGVPLEELHAWCAATQAAWPLTMTTLTTHDTKRSEDVRARLAVLSELPHAWGGAVAEWRALAAHLRSPEGWPDANTEYLIWQTLVGAWPVDVDRLTTYLHKAAREAKRHTSWVDPNPAYEEALRSFVAGVLGDYEICSAVEGFVERLHPHFRANVLAQKLVQLTMPGVPDVYQGTEMVTLSLVDPDNRRAVDYAERQARLGRLDAGEAPRDLDDEKLLVTARALRLRRDHPSWFGAEATYTPLGATTEHVIAFARAGATVTVAPRLTVGLGRRGGWGDATAALPAGEWRDVLSGATYAGGPVRCADLLGGALPVALLVRT